MAALIAKRAARMASAERDVDLRHRGIEYAQGLLEQLLACLVAFQDDNPQLVSHSGEESR